MSAPLKRTPGISNPVDVYQRELGKYADEEHATHGAQYLQRLVQRDRARSFIAKIRRKLAGLVTR